MSIKFLDLFKSSPPTKPVDLSNFEDAREKLHKTIQNTTAEIDAFGAMVRDMRGLRPLKKKRSSKPR